MEPSDPAIGSKECREQESTGLRSLVARRLQWIVLAAIAGTAALATLREGPSPTRTELEARRDFGGPAHGKIGRAVPLHTDVLAWALVALAPHGDAEAIVAAGHLPLLPGPFRIPIDIAPQLEPEFGELTLSGAIAGTVHGEADGIALLTVGDDLRYSMSWPALLYGPSSGSVRVLDMAQHLALRREQPVARVGSGYSDPSLALLLCVRSQADAGDIPRPRATWRDWFRAAASFEPVPDAAAIARAEERLSPGVDYPGQGVVSLPAGAFTTWGPLLEAATASFVLGDDALRAQVAEALRARPDVWKDALRAGVRGRLDEPGRFADAMLGLSWVGAVDAPAGAWEGLLIGVLPGAQLPQHPSHRLAQLAPLRALRHASPRMAGFARDAALQRARTDAVTEGAAFDTDFADDRSGDLGRYLIAHEPPSAAPHVVETWTALRSAALDRVPWRPRFWLTHTWLPVALLALLVLALAAAVLPSGQGRRVDGPGKPALTAVLLLSTITVGCLSPTVATVPLWFWVLLRWWRGGPRAERALIVLGCAGSALAVWTGDRSILAGPALGAVSGFAGTCLWLVLGRLALETGAARRSWAFATFLALHAAVVSAVLVVGSFVRDWTPTPSFALTFLATLGVLFLAFLIRHRPPIASVVSTAADTDRPA